MFGVVFGGIVAGVLFLGPLSPGVSQAEGGDSSPALLVSAVGSMYETALTSPFQEAGQGIEDREIAQYYHTLLKNCGLDGTTEEEAGLPNGHREIGGSYVGG